MKNNLSNGQMEMLLNLASKKLGTNKQDLQQQLNQGKLNNFMSNLNPTQASQLQQALSNPIIAKQMLNSPQAQALLKQLMGDK